VIRGVVVHVMSKVKDVGQHLIRREEVISAVERVDDTLFGLTTGACAGDATKHEKS
jgi:hypothetical protein